jgi:hypothetical protein
MHRIYQVTIHGRTLESRDLRKLLARAVSEKRVMDDRLRKNVLPRTASAAAPQAVPLGA